jgi:hypothetical protein
MSINTLALMETLSNLFINIEKDRNCPICFDYEQSDGDPIHGEYCQLKELHTHYTEIKDCVFVKECES